MSDETVLRLASALAGLAFGAGAAMWQLRRVTRDVNGVGRKFYRMAALLVRWADTDEKRHQAADLIEGK